MILLLVLGIIMSTRMPASELFIVGQTSKRNRSTILGIYYFTAVEVGGILNPAIGRIIDRFGFNAGFASAAALLFCATLVCAFFLREDRS